MRFQLAQHVSYLGAKRAASFHFGVAWTLQGNQAKTIQGF
jgi:hypothetical protein